MNPATLGLVLAFVLAAPALAAQAFGEICHGTETIQVGSQQPITTRYDLTFNADLDRGVYCYGACGSDQSFPISRSVALPIELAAVDDGHQMRRLTFDPRSSELTDVQVIEAGSMTTTRRASATCQAAPFRSPHLNPVQAR